MKVIEPNIYRTLTLGRDNICGRVARIYVHDRKCACIKVIAALI